MLKRSTYFGKGTNRLRDGVGAAVGKTGNGGSTGSPVDIGLGHISTTGMRFHIKVGNDHGIQMCIVTGC